MGFPYGFVNFVSVESAREAAMAMGNREVHMCGGMCMLTVRLRGKGANPQVSSKMQKIAVTVLTWGFCEDYFF